MAYDNYNKDRFRVRRPVKSFRDLEVYQKTVQLSSEVEPLGNSEMIKAAARIPELIAEAYGDKYDSKAVSHQKLTEAVTLITDMITKIDILREKFKGDAGKKRNAGQDAQHVSYPENKSPKSQEGMGQGLQF